MSSKINLQSPSSSLATDATCNKNSRVTGYITSCNPSSGCTAGFQCDANQTSSCASGYCFASLYYV